jgi:CRISPR-associated protein Cas2
VYILITYDVTTTTRQGRRRLRRVARACEDYGQRVQNSVFEVKAAEKEWILLKNRLVKEIDEKEDSLRFYFLDHDLQIEHYGTKQPINLEEPIVL